MKIGRKIKKKEQETWGECVEKTRWRVKGIIWGEVYDWTMRKIQQKTNKKGGERSVRREMKGKGRGRERK